ncbi:hypothetical protein BSFA1_35850 [Burkholderia sp. SFA1]|uniref:hypothetical protein n=1 Tax=unclassified Caballeronia TaxID=2646786 RepID=UPI001F3603D7|nr:MULTISPECIES: hypothetical protein [unclassified Caballeronia]MCE4544478.1 hypothetical protein [Caballeronia sp. PC1]MCE4571630.1 hypothetical protein [Caballeronia sp. CLC5]BBP98456.1 hypothetical protein BSFA1_35850 [Burkholderia sp. SFA1]
MNIRLLSVSAVAAISLTCAKTASAGTSVQVSYVAPAIVYAPPRPVYYYAPPPRPTYYYMPARTVVVEPVVAPVAVAVPPPRPPVVAVSAYAPAPAVRVMYAQPVLAAPVVVVR